MNEQEYLEELARAKREWARQRAALPFPEER